MSNSHKDGVRNSVTPKTEIIPAVMASSYEDLTFKVAAMNGIAKLLQIDAMDGKFVENKSWIRFLFKQFCYICISKYFNLLLG